MKVIRHGKPKKEYLATLKRRPTKADYDKLVTACMEAIINGEIDVLVSFAYVAKFPKGFPKGILVQKVDDKNIHRIKARKLLTWLNENGHTLVTVEALKRQRWAFTRLENSFAELQLTKDVEDIFDDNVDFSQAFSHNVGSVDEKEEG